jgi:protein-disulfide isomerase
MTQCAIGAGKFWQMHDLLFLDQKQITSRYISDLPEKVGLRSADMSNCIASDGPAAMSRDATLARAVGIRATPFFLAGVTSPDGAITVSKYIIGARPLQEFVTLIEGLLRTSK